MRQTSTMLNLAQSGTTIGPIIATPLVVWACTTMGWRPAFVILGAFGLSGACWILATGSASTTRATGAAVR
jgi:predicted MFS family arabinose efflux permease